MIRFTVVALTAALTTSLGAASIVQNAERCPCMGGKCPMAASRPTQGPGARMGMRRAVGPRMGMGPGMGRGPDDARRQDMAIFHALLADHKKIRRSVTQLFDGVDTLTESDDPHVAKLIKEHVPAMYARLKSGRGIHLVDPLFAELFKNGRKIDQTITQTDKGVRVIEQSIDPYTVKLIKAHAASVDDLVKRGMAGFMELHEAPKR